MVDIYKIQRFSRFDFDFSDTEFALTSFKPTDFSKIEVVGFSEKNKRDVMVASQESGLTRVFLGRYWDGEGTPRVK